MKEGARGSRTGQIAERWRDEPVKQGRNSLVFLQRIALPIAVNLAAANMVRWADKAIGFHALDPF